MNKKSFFAEPLFWILLVLFAPAAILYAMAYSSKQADEQRKLDEKEIATLDLASDNQKKSVKSEVDVQFVFKKNPLQFLLLQNPNLSINSGPKEELQNNVPLLKRIPTQSKIEFSVPYMGSEAGKVVKALKLDGTAHYVVEFTMGLFVFTPATVKIIKR
jgi:hypothetical protein